MRNVCKQTAEFYDIPETTNTIAVVVPLKIGQVFGRIPTPDVTLITTYADSTAVKVMITENVEYCVRQDDIEH